MKRFGDIAIKKLIALIKAKFGALAKVATSGSYNDLSNQPTIPSVGNGTITIKQAGSTKGSFTTNQSGNTTIELTDTNTWRGIQDNLTSDSSTDSLSAKQGKALKTLLDGKATSTHYHTKSQISDFPTSLKNPNVLTVQANGSKSFTYDGSAAKTINLKAGTNITLSADSSGNITINSTASGSSTGDVGTELYIAPAGGGIYCDGNTAFSTNNSTKICLKSDLEGTTPYKRLKIYIRCPYGLACADMPVDRAQQTSNTTFGNMQGGIVFPTGDNTDGATNNYVYKINWRVSSNTADNGDIYFQVTDSGWLNLGTGSVGGTNYANNSTTGISSAAPTWNQRHNDNYSVYRIVGYKN